MVGKTLSAEKVAYLSFLLNEKGINVTEIARKIKISRSSVYRYKNTGINDCKRPSKKCVNKGGRPRKLNKRDVRNLVRCLKLLRQREGNFTCKRLAKEAGIDCKNINIRTIRRAMNKEGFKYLQARKKGVLRETDLKKRLSFAKKMKREFSSNVWKEDINFFLDGVSFAYKRHPLKATLQENFLRYLNLPGNHIRSYGFKMVILVKIVMQRKRLCRIPPRSPDINPIENLFHLVRRELDRQALSGNITHETYEQFSSRVSQTFKTFPCECIDNIIGSMDKRMNMIISRKGQRIKY